MTKYEPRAPYDFNRVTALKPVDNDMPLMDRKERGDTIVFIAPNPAFKAYNPYPARRYTRAVTVKIFWNKNGQGAHALLWAGSRDGSVYLRGHGSASGYGYDKESAAIDEAFEKAGVTMLRHFNGCGVSTAIVAIEALAKRLGWGAGEVMTF